MLKFDHIPKVPQTSYRENAFKEFTELDVTRSKIEPKSVEDYKNNIFIINILRNKVYGMEGQIMEYEQLKKTNELLQEQITAEIAKSYRINFMNKKDRTTMYMKLYQSITRLRFIYKLLVPN